MAILAIDQGTSGTKAVVVDDDVISVAEWSIRPRYASGGVVEQDPAALLESVIGAAREAIDAAAIGIDAVALANQGETVLAWDKNTGEPLTPALSWQDRRAHSVCDELSDFSSLIQQKTGLQLDPYFSAPKMAWIRRNWTTDGVVTTTDSWLVHQFTGEFVTDTSTASRSLLLDLENVNWVGELLTVFGLEGEELPRLVASDEIVGTTTLFGGEVPVTGLIVDQQAALLGESCIEPGTAKCTYGTGAFLLAQLGQDAVRFDNGLTTSVAWTLRNRTSYCADGQVYTAASAVRWLIDLGLISSANDLDAVAASSAGKIRCVPAFAGLAAPWWRADIGASFAGLNLSSGKPEIVRSVLDGIAAQITELAKLVACGTDGRSVRRLRVDGGLTQSTVLMQIQSDLLQAPVDVFGSPHATALGAVACARLALDPTLAVADAPLPWQPAKSYTPAVRADAAERFQRTWLQALDAQLANSIP